MSKYTFSLFQLFTLMYIHTVISAPKIVMDLSETDIEGVINEASKPLIIKWYAEWCPPCKKLKPVFEEYASKNQGKYIFAQANVDSMQNSANKYTVMSMPTVTIFKNKALIGRFSGTLSLGQLKKEIEEIVNKP